MRNCHGVAHKGGESPLPGRHDAPDRYAERFGRPVQPTDGGERRAGLPRANAAGGDAELHRLLEEVVIRLRQLQEDGPAAVEVAGMRITFEETFLGGLAPALRHI